jgi:ABC-2 type transport system permease protein
MIATGDISVGRAAWVLVRLRARRLRNRVFARSQKKSGGEGARVGTASRGRSAWLGAFIGIYFPFLAFQVSGRLLKAFAHHVNHGHAAGAFTDAVRSVAAAELALAAFAALVGSLATRELGAPEWDLEWLVTLPMPRRSLLGVRILERAIVNPTALLLVFPFATMVAWECGLRVCAPLLGAACTLPLLVLVAVAWVVLESTLRLRLAPQGLRNAQALLTVLSFGLFFLAWSPTTGAPAVYRLADAFAPCARWTPPALAIDALSNADAAHAAMSLVVLGLEAVLGFALGLRWLEHLLRHGVVATGSRESGPRGARPVRRAPVPAKTSLLASPLAWLPPVPRRELRLLARDRTFLVQTLLMPLVIVGMQVYFGARRLTFQHSDPSNVMAAAFGVAAYALLSSAFTILSAEGQALWLLFTLPQRLETVLRQKAALWGSLALFYPIVVTCLYVGAHGPSLRVAGLAFIAIAGVPVFALIASAFGVLAWDPSASELPQRRLRPAFLYLYMALAGIYTYSLYASTLRERGILMILTTLVALALWQKARDHLPYVLDTTAAPPARVSVADGLIAALVFFLAQVLVTLALADGGDAPTVGLVYKSFIWAGAITFTSVRLVHWRTHATGVPRFWGPRAGRAALVGMGGAVVAALLGATYLFVLRRWVTPPATKPGELEDAAWALFPLAVVAAPLFEEYIFRGLLFGGLSRSVRGPLAALAAAAIFAMIHPPYSVVPVFCMALVATAAYARTGLLIAPVVVHAGYNAAVLIIQMTIAK